MPKLDNWLPHSDNWLPSSDNWLTESDNWLPESDNCTGNTVVLVLLNVVLLNVAFPAPDTSPVHNGRFARFSAVVICFKH